MFLDCDLVVLEYPKVLPEEIFDPVLVEYVFADQFPLPIVIILSLS